jgi:hypothetical protein
MQYLHPQRFLREPYEKLRFISLKQRYRKPTWEKESWKSRNFAARSYYSGSLRKLVLNHPLMTIDCPTTATNFSWQIISGLRTKFSSQLIVLPSPHQLRSTICLQKHVKMVCVMPSEVKRDTFAMRVRPLPRIRALILMCGLILKSIKVLYHNQRKSRTVQYLLLMLKQ